RISTGQALGGGDDVRLVVVALSAEPLSKPAPSADDFVGYEQHVVAVADLAHPLEVAIGRREAAASVLDRLEDHSRDRVRLLDLDPLGNRLRKRLNGHAGREAIRVGVGHVAATWRQRLERLTQTSDPGGGKRA